MFDNMKLFWDMQKKMQQIKQELENINFDVVSSDNLVKITMSGTQEVKEINIQREIRDIDKVSLEKAIRDAYNRALKRSHEIAAQKMKDVTGLSLPGLV